MATDFRRVFESLRVAAVVTDPAGAITFANDTFAALVGSEARELEGRDLAALFADNDRKRVQQNLARVGGGKAATALFDAALPGDGKATWVSVSLQPALDARDKPEGVVAILHDIGAQREVDEALNLVTARLLALAEVTPTGMLIETAPGDIELVNEVFCRELSLDSAPQSLSGLAAWDVLGRSPVMDKKALAQAKRQPAEAASIALVLEDGREAALEREPLVVESGHGGAVWILRVAGGAAAAEEGAAEVAVITKIGEELSVALEGIAALALRVQQMEIDPATIERVQRVRSSTQTAMAAIGELVDFSRISGDVVLRKSPFALRAALAQLIARVSQSAEERGCRLRMKVEQDVTDALEGDVERVQMVLRNLLESAFALVPGAEVTLQITPEYTTENGIQLSFAVIASGPAAQQAANLRAAPDAGMGVALAKYMVAAMGGKLTIAARAGADAMYGFSIEFPVGPAAPAPRRPTYVSLVAMNVLVVSAEPEQRQSVSKVLRDFRMAPMEADNAGMAIALLERLAQEGTPIPLVILSNRLPVQDGFLLAFRIKNDEKLRDTLVMMLATDGRPGDAIACRENGIAAYMRYPISDRQLNEAIVAVTGASVDADETPTLVTRHSLREQRKGATVLLVDASRDSQILAAHILGRHDCSVVVAQDLKEAVAALEQDVYDIVLVDTSLAGLDGKDAARTLRGHMGKNAESTRVVATSLDHGPAFQKAMTGIGFDATLAKPFRKDDLLALLARVYDLQMIKVLIVDDHEIVRAGLRALLDRIGDFEIVGEVHSAEEAIAAVPEHAPDVVLMDLKLPDGSGVDACREILSVRPETRVLFLTSYPEELARMSTVLAGAAGYLVKDIVYESLVQSIRDVAAGKMVVDPAVAQAIGQQVENAPALSKQECRVLALVVEGKTNKQIGVELGLSEKTVRNYLSNAFQKLGVTRRSQAAVIFSGNAGR